MLSRIRQFVFDPFKEIHSFQFFFLAWFVLLGTYHIYRVVYIYIHILYLGGGFTYFFIFTPIWGKIPILTHIFQRA